MLESILMPSAAPSVIFHTLLSFVAVTVFSVPLGSEYLTITVFVSGSVGGVISALPLLVLTFTSGAFGAVLSGTVFSATSDFISSVSPFVIAVTFVFASALAFLIVKDFPSALATKSLSSAIDHVPLSAFVAVTVFSVPFAGVYVINNLFASGSLSFGVTVTSPLFPSTVTVGVCTLAFITTLPFSDDFFSVSV